MSISHDHETREIAKSQHLSPLNLSLKSQTYRDMCGREFVIHLYIRSISTLQLLNV